MRFLIIRKADAYTEAEDLPTEELFAQMGAYMEEMAKAGVLLSGDGLQPSRKGARVKFHAGKPTVVDGPFAETKELIAGYWLIDVKSRDDAIEWVKRIPFEEGMEVELRKVFEASDFAVDAVSEEHLAKEKARREENQRPIGA